MRTPVSNTVQQVGGTHYGTGYGHWDYVKASGLPYLEGCATKYLTRWRGKNGIQDLEKALSYVDKIAEGMDETYHNERDLAPCDYLLMRMFSDNKVPDMEQSLIYGIVHWKNLQDLKFIRQHLANFIKWQKEKADEGAEPTSAYINQDR